MSKTEMEKLGEAVHAYCQKFNVPLEVLFEILEDQQVTPMIRGKSMEHNAFPMSDVLLPRTAWSVQKLTRMIHKR